MFLVHQIVNALIDPVSMMLGIMIVGFFLMRRGRLRTGLCFSGAGIALLFVASWPPFVDFLGLWLEADYPVAQVEECPVVDAVVVLGGGVGCAPEDANYPYPLLQDGADRVWYGAKLLLAQKAKEHQARVKLYCTGPDVTRSTPPVLMDLGLSKDDVVALDGPLNTEEEARKYATVLDGKRILLVTSALHMKRATRIFRKYAPGLTVVPAATDHHFFRVSSRFSHWQYYVPNLGSLGLFSAIEHELIGLLRYSLW